MTECIKNLFDLVFINQTETRYIQYGAIHGSIEACGGTRYPGIYVRLTEKSVWKFVKTLGQANGISVYNATRNGMIIQKL